MISQQELRRLFVYEPENGMLRKVVGQRKPYPWRNSGSGNRYLLTQVGKVHLYLHQAVFLFHHGYLPSMIDHIDCDTRNNRIENLRACTSAQNQYNSRMKVTNKSGFKGVRLHACGAFQAKIGVSKRQVSLGYYKTAEEAGRAYSSAAQKHAGEFWRV